MPLDKSIKKVILLGSGSIKIGEAGEFDYSGSQALKALREEGIQTILVNPNVATIQTDTRLADKVYFLPVTKDYVEQVIQQERPDGILLSFGGQTALNCGVALEREGILSKYNVRVLGTPVRGIELTEDRDLFKKVMMENGIECPVSEAVYSVEEARIVAKRIGYPVIIRVAFTLGGRGGGVAFNEYELDAIAEKGLANSIVHQILVEEYVGSWKQIEYEVMRDATDNNMVVCNMENVLGMRVHTGDNTVVAPSQTINNHEYHFLRELSIRAARAVGIVGECNIQFALDTESQRYYAIEINARLSRSSALASKATGYPIAYVAAKIALGYSLSELANKVTGVTSACFEPALDYVVVKMPRFDFRKFERVRRELGSQMKSVGEVMAIGRSFEEGIQKAIRMLDIGRDGILDYRPVGSLELLENALVHPTDEILFHIAEALSMGVSIEDINRRTWVNCWFISKIKNIVDFDQRLSKLSLEELTPQLLREAKKLGMSDKMIAGRLKTTESFIRELRKSNQIVPLVKQIDSLAAEWPAKTNYLYLSYDGRKNNVEFSSPEKKKVMVLGAGCYRIGSSVEFDWCTMNMVWALQERGYEVIVVNCNPETVSTDYDMSERLYFEEITLERVLDIYDNEDPFGIVCCVGGQTANNLIPKLAGYGVRLLGTASSNLDRAEDRAKFSNLLDKLGISQPKWVQVVSEDTAKEFAKDNYPVIVRPSYVLSGAAMRVIWSESELLKFLKDASDVSPDYPVVISKFIQNAKEAEVDAVSDGQNVLIGAIIEHVEKAGVHSGDATMRIPAEGLSDEIQEKIKDYTKRIAQALEIRGPLNVQYIVKGGDVLVIECNVRASRSMPFVSKMNGLNLLEAAADAILGNSIERYLVRNHAPSFKVGVKVPQFSFMQLEGADSLLGVEMQSTGEVACFGDSFFDAFCKALASSGYRIPMEGNVFVSFGGTELKQRTLNSVRKLHEMGYKIFATEHTAEFLSKHGLSNVTVLYKMMEKDRKPNISDYLAERKIDLIFNIPSSSTLKEFADMQEDDYKIRRKAVELGIPVFTNPENIDVFVKGLSWLRSREITISALTSTDYGK